MKMKSIKLYIVLAFVSLAIFFAGMSKAVCVVNAVKNGHRISYARGPVYVYLCAREGKWMDTPGGGWADLKLGR